MHKIIVVFLCIILSVNSFFLNVKAEDEGIEDNKTEEKDSGILENFSSVNFSLSEQSESEYWSSLDKSLEEIVIPNYVTYIPNDAFYGVSTLSKITIPESVTSIGNNAFQNCTSLISIDIPDSVTSIGYNAFYRCSSLSSVIISSNLTSIDSYTFYNCGSLTSIDIPDSVASIGNSAFENCSKLKNIMLTDSVTSIGKNAFSGCSSLTIFTSFESKPSGWNQYLDLRNVYWGCDDKTYDFFTSITEEDTEIVIPNYVTAIPGKIFAGNKNITKVTLSNSVTSIGYSAFDGCSSLKTIELSDSLKSIGDSAFLGCVELTSIILPENLQTIGNGAFQNCRLLKSINIPNSLNSIGNYAFRNCASLKSIYIPDTLSNIGNYAFSGCSMLTIFTKFAEKPNDWDSYWNTTDNVYWNCCDEAYNFFISITGDETEIVIPNYVTAIPGNIFSQNKNVKKIILCDSVTYIGDYAFNGCTSLKTIDLPDSLISIGSYAFCGCSSLRTLFLTNKVSKIGHVAFSGCDSLTIFTSLESPASGWNGLGTFSKNVYWGCTDEAYNFFKSVSESDTEITIPDYVTSIPGNVFKNFGNIKKVKLSNSITSIGENAFYNCDSLEMIYIPDSVEIIKENAFNYIPSFVVYTEYKTAPDGWSNNLHLDNAIYWNCNADIYDYFANLSSDAKEITIPNYVTEIPRSVFSDFDKLEKIIIPNSVKTIGSNAFSNCDSLSSIYIPSSVTKISNMAFSSCPLITIYTEFESIPGTWDSNWNGNYSAPAVGIVLNTSLEKYKALTGLIIEKDDDYLYISYDDKNINLGNIENVNFYETKNYKVNLSKQYFTVENNVIIIPMYQLLFIDDGKVKVSLDIENEPFAYVDLDLQNIRPTINQLENRNVEIDLKTETFADYFYNLCLNYSFNGSTPSITFHDRNNSYNYIASFHSANLNYQGGTFVKSGNTVVIDYDQLLENNVPSSDICAYIRFNGHSVSTNIESIEACEELKEEVNIVSDEAGLIITCDNKDFISKLSSPYIYDSRKTELKKTSGGKISLNSYYFLNDKYLYINNRTREDINVELLNDGYSVMIPIEKIRNAVQNTDEYEVGLYAKGYTVVKKTIKISSFIKELENKPELVLKENGDIYIYAEEDFLKALTAYEKNEDSTSFISIYEYNEKNQRENCGHISNSSSLRLPLKTDNNGQYYVLWSKKYQKELMGGAIIDGLKYLSFSVDGYKTIDEIPFVFGGIHSTAPDDVSITYCDQTVEITSSNSEWISDVYGLQIFKNNNFVTTVNEIAEKTDDCIVFDLHSYNIADGEYTLVAYVSGFCTTNNNVLYLSKCNKAINGIRIAGVSNSVNSVPRFSLSFAENMDLLIESEDLNFLKSLVKPNKSETINTNKFDYANANYYDYGVIVFVNSVETKYLFNTYSKEIIHLEGNFVRVDHDVLGSIYNNSSYYVYLYGSKYASANIYLNSNDVGNDIKKAPQVRLSVADNVLKFKSTTDFAKNVYAVVFEDGDKYKCANSYFIKKEGNSFTVDNSVLDLDNGEYTINVYSYGYKEIALNEKIKINLKKDTPEFEIQPLDNGYVLISSNDSEWLDALCHRFDRSSNSTNFVIKGIRIGLENGIYSDNRYYNDGFASSNIEEYTCIERVNDGVIFNTKNAYSGIVLNSTYKLTLQAYGYNVSDQKILTITHANKFTPDLIEYEIKDGLIYISSDDNEFINNAQNIRINNYARDAGYGSGSGYDITFNVEDNMLVCELHGLYREDLLAGKPLTLDIKSEGYQQAKLYINRESHHIIANIMIDDIVSPLASFYEGQNDNIYLPNIEYTGKVFAGWYLDSSFTGASINSINTLDLTNDIYVYAKWIDINEQLTRYDSLTALLGSDIALRVTTEVMVPSFYIHEIKFCYQIGDKIFKIDNGKLQFRSNNGHIYFDCVVPFSAKELGKDAKATIWVECQGIEINRRDISLADYLSDVKEQETNEVVVSLVDALEEYGDMAYNYFNDESQTTENLATTQNIHKETSSFIFKNDNLGSEDNMIFKSASMILGSRMSLRVYFEANDMFENDDFAIYPMVNGEEIKNYRIKDDYIEIFDLKVSELLNIYSFEAKYEDDAIATLQYSPMTYINAVLKTNDKDHANLRNLAKSIYGYAKAAEDYINE